MFPTCELIAVLRVALRPVFTPVRRGVAWVRRIHGHAVTPRGEPKAPRACVARSGATRSNVVPLLPLIVLTGSLTRFRDNDTSLFS